MFIQEVVETIVPNYIHFSKFHRCEVVGRGSETQLHMDKTLII